MKHLRPDLAYRLLEAGPLLLVTTIDDGRPNVMTLGFHMMVRHAPPLIGVVIGPWDHSHAAFTKSRECVLAIPTVDLAATAVDIGNASGRDINKFARFGLTRQPARKVAPPLIGECLANIECRLVDDTLAERYDLHILEAVAITYDDKRTERRTLHHNGDGTFFADGELVDLRERMVLWKSFQRDL